MCVFLSVCHVLLCSVVSALGAVVFRIGQWCGPADKAHHLSAKPLLVSLQQVTRPLAALLAYSV